MIAWDLEFDKRPHLYSIKKLVHIQTSIELFSTSTPKEPPNGSVNNKLPIRPETFLKFNFMNN